MKLISLVVGSYVVSLSSFLFFLRRGFVDISWQSGMPSLNLFDYDDTLTGAEQLL